MYTAKIFEDNVGPDELD